MPAEITHKERCSASKRNKKGGLFLNRKDRVISHLREVTARQIRTAPLDCTPLETEEIARSLQLDRANVSKLLNELWNEGEALKVQGRPILYLSLRTLQAAYPDSFFPSTLPGIAELRRLLQSGAAPSAVPGDVQPDTLPDFLRVPLEGALSACAYPPYGLPLLLTSASQEDVHRLVQLLMPVSSASTAEAASMGKRASFGRSSASPRRPPRTAGPPRAALSSPAPALSTWRASSVCRIPCWKCC